MGGKRDAGGGRPLDAAREALVATIKVLEEAPASWAAEGFSRAQETIDQRFSLKPRGHPLYALFTDRRITPPVRSTRQENYHHFRALMHCIQALDRMMERGVLQYRGGAW